MNQNSYAILALCSHLCVGDGIVPLEPKEWSTLAISLLDRGMQPAQLLELSAQELKTQLVIGTDYAERLARLIGRSASLSFEMSKYENMGIYAVTRADENYPARLKKVLGNQCPPIFYYAGDLKLAENGSVGYVGTRTVSEADITFTRMTVQKTVQQSFGVVSGGAKGVDSIAESEALSCGSSAIAYLSDSMLRRMKLSATVRAVQDGRLLLLSVVKPDAGFNAGIAMMRNRYIYAQSRGTVVIKADYNKGGTWAGAMENLRHKWCAEFCRENKKYPGNTALIRAGAIPIDEAWDGNVLSETYSQSEAEQLTLFDL